nr:MAG TPA: hypothetical protein [Caudoviricetes sp.]
MTPVPPFVKQSTYLGMSTQLSEIYPRLIKDSAAI